MTQQQSLDLGDGILIVPSETAPGVTYQIDIENKTCTCLAFTKRRGKFPCKHLFKAGIVDEEITIDIWKSAFQKAFRRGLPDLLEEAFQHIWVVDWNWFNWRTMLLAGEDGWKSSRRLGIALGNMAKLQHTALSKKMIASIGPGLLKCLKEECIKPKNQDGNGLRWLAKILVGMDDNDVPRQIQLLGILKSKLSHVSYGTLLTLMNYSRRLRVADKTASKAKAIWQDLWVDDNELALIKGKTPEEYQVLCESITPLFLRAKKGGGIGHASMLLSAALLMIEAYSFGSYGGDLEALNQTHTNPLDFECREPDSHTVPWYAVDMHTGVGKRVLSHLANVFSHKYTEQFIRDLWFLEETAQVNNVDFNSLWWGKMKAVVYIYHNITPAQAIEIWETEVGPAAKTKVLEWAPNLRYK